MQEFSAVSRAPKRFSFDGLARFALMATSVLALLVFTVSPSVPFLGTKALVIMLGTLVALAFYILARLTRGNVIVPPTLLLPALWLVPFAYALSTLFSGVNPSLALFGVELSADTFGFVIALCAFATLVALTLRRETEYASFMRVIGYASGLFLIVQVTLILTARFFPNIIAPLSNLVGSFSDAGMLVGLGVIVALLALRLMQPSFKGRFALSAGIILGLLVLALTNSLSIWILVGLVALGLLIEALMRRHTPSDEGELEGVATLLADSEDAFGERRSFGLPLAVLMVAVVFVIGGSFFGNALSSFFGTSFIDVRPSWQATFDVGSHVYASSPLFGSGPTTFGAEWLKFRDRSLNDTIFWSVDFVSGVGYIPTSAVTTGVLGALAWIAFLCSFLFIGVRALLLRLPRERIARFVAVSAFAGAAYVLTLATLSVPGPVVLFAGFMFIGLFISVLRYGKERIEWGIAFSRSPRIGFVIVFSMTLLLIATAYTGYVISLRYAASLSYNAAAEALSRGELERADAHIARSLSYAKTSRTFRLAAVAGVARMNEIANATDIPEAEAQRQFQAALSASVQSAMAATQFAPSDYQNWMALGGVYQSVVPLKIAGAAEAAAQAYARAAQLAPTSPAIPYTIAQLSIAAEDYPSAEKSLFEAITLKRDYTQAILLLSQLQVSLGKAREALQAVEAAIYFAPNDPATLFQAGVLRLSTGDRAGAIEALSRAVTQNPRYANARFFLAVAHAVSGDIAAAITELEEVGALSQENATAVASDLEALRAGKNPYPPARLRTLGVPSAPVEEPEPSAEEVE